MSRGQQAGSQGVARAGARPGAVPGGPHLADRLAATGARDLFLLRRVAEGHWLHVAGLGRGAGWAGVVAVTAAEGDAILRPLSVGAVRRWRSAAPAHVLGPYHAAGAALVRLDPDRMVLVGRVDAPLDPVRADAATLRALAAAALAHLGDVVPVGKGVTDELEVLRALQVLHAASPETVAEALEHVAATVARALACDVVVARTGRGALVVHRRGEPARPLLDGREEEVARAMLGLPAGATRCVQNAWTEPLPSPLAPADGVVSHLVVALPEPVGGSLLCLHSTDLPRGFTQLCQQLAERLASAAAVLLSGAQRRADLEQQVRVDALTGLASRAAWEERLLGCQAAADAGLGCGVVLLDVDNLKAVNDHSGHAAGDLLLRTLARRLTAALLPGEWAARLGGDEFAVVVPGVGARELEQRRAALHAAVEHDGGDGVRAEVSVGAASAEPGGRIQSAVAAADTAMYATKRRRRSDRLALSPGR